MIHTPITMDTTSAALAWCAAGASVVRVAVDGSKRPLGAWKQAQAQAADADTVGSWFAGGHPGVGVVCGAVSGELEMLEIEGRAAQDGTAQRFLAALADHGLTDVRDRVVAGYSETSPSGGIHLYYRVSDGPALGNTKLAQRVTDDGVVPLIETRGEGGFVVCAPSHGPVHPTGRPWQIVTGSPGTVATITADERDAVHSVARTLDEVPPPDPIPDPVPLDERRDGGVPPGADYTARATWDDVLTPAGWAVVSRNGNRTYWRRPGKRLGISAVSGGPAGDYLYVWTTSTELPAETGLSKWRVYALLHHGGDFTAAAKALSGRGYGQRGTVAEPHRPVLTVLPGYGSTNGAAVATVTTMPGVGGATTHARTDDAMALSLVDAYGSTIRYCPERGRWLVWSGHRWAWCPDDSAVREHVKTLARNLSEDDKADVRHKVHALSAPGTTNIIRQARSDPRVVVRLAELDAWPFELNTPRGIVNLRTGVLTPPDPARLHTRSTLVAPDPDADTGHWDAFLAATFAGHEDIPGYLQRLAGYSITGAVLDHVLPFCYGTGQNGKGVFLDTLVHILGDYATVAPEGFLMIQRYPKHETELADLAGMRFVVCSELNEGDRFDEARIKSLTGGDPVKARFIQRDYFTFTPSHHLWLMGNHEPTVKSGGPSFWRRVRIVPFANTVPPERRIPGLMDMLTHDHGPAVLAWLITGARAYLADGLPEPDSVQAATTDYEHDQDSVTRWVEDCCYVGGGDQVTTAISAARAAYERWCTTEGLTPKGPRALGAALRDRFGVQYTSGGRAGRRYIGLALAPDAVPGGPLTRGDFT